MRDTETAMQDISLAVDTVQSALQRAKALVMEPCGQLELKTQQLRNLHNTMELLRHVIQRLKLTAKLRQQADATSGSYQDLAKAAKLLADIETIGSEADLAGIDVIEADDEFLEKSWQDVQGQAEACAQAQIPCCLAVGLLTCIIVPCITLSSTCWMCYTQTHAGMMHVLWLQHCASWLSCGQRHRRPT